METAHSAINLDSYFEFQSLPNHRQAIRIAGTRVGIEFVLREYLQGASPEELVMRFQTLTLEQIHATITYYLARRIEIDAYIAETERERQHDSDQDETQPNAFRQSLRNRLDRERTRLREQSSSSAQS